MGLRLAPMPRAASSEAGRGGSGGCGSSVPAGRPITASKASRLAIRAFCRPLPRAAGGYLGADKQVWRKHDAVALIEDGARFSDFLVDYGDADPFLTEQLRPELLQAACEKAKIPLTLRRQPGYDHSYYFISTFMADHLRWHADRLKA